LADTRQSRFGVFDFDAATLELRKAQRPVRLRPQALKLLRLLVARPRQVISREEIHKELWDADVFVDFEQGVNHSVKQLRAALGDDADAPRFIETLPRRGYRFIAPVEFVSVDDRLPIVPSTTGDQRAVTRFAGPQKWVFLAGLVAVAGLVILAVTRTRDAPWAVPPNPTLAVLPFDAVNMPADMHYLGVSLADAVIARLAAGGRVRVRPTTTTVTYDKRATDFQAVGRRLQVDYVLAGTLQADGATVRAGLQLVHTATARPVWSASVDVRAADWIALEDAITNRVVSALDAKALTPGGRGRTENPSAYEAYLQGRFYLARLTSEGTLAAVAAFERALAMDSKYPLAHAGLANAGAQMSIRFASEADVSTWRIRAEQHARRALELEGTLAEAHEALAAVARYADFDWDRTIEQSLEALRLNPSLDLPHLYLASALQHIGRLDLVEAEIAAGLEGVPLNLTEAFRLRGMTALWSGSFADARTQFERLRELSSKPVSNTPLAQALYYAGEPAQAEAMLAGLRGSAQSEQRARATLASFLAARGETRPALALVDEVLSREYRDHHVAYGLGATYAGLGRPVEAFRWLREAARTGFLCHPWYLTDPLLRPLQAHEDFQRFITEVKSAADRIAAGALRDVARQ
jgi:TolB-like protein/DNA-binding winged helix-turn-helix (wHTH) protein